MNEKILKEKIQRVLNECQKHKQRILEASEDLEKFMPLDEKSYKSLSKDEVQALDQFLFRFSKLQDAMERKLFKLVLILKEGDEEFVNSLNFIDILNHLEKMKILYTKQWQELRDIRNELAHNYDDDSQEMAEILNIIYVKKDVLLQVLENISNYIKNVNLTESVDKNR